MAFSPIKAISQGLSAYVKQAVSTVPEPSPVAGKHHETPSAYHEVRRSKLVAPFAEFYTWYRKQAEYKKGPVETAQWPQNVQEHFHGTRAYFIPGFLNFSPSDRFFSEFTSLAGQGGAFLSVSSNTQSKDSGSDFSRLGGYEAVYHERWTHEVGTVVSRLAHDFDRYPDADNILLLGHSKGGLLSYVLSALSHAYHENGRAFTPQIYKTFPGLQDAVGQDPEQVDRLMESLYRGDFIAIGAPLTGLDGFMLKVAKISMFDYLFHGTSDSFSSDFLEQVYSVFGEGKQPEDLLDMVVFSKTSDSLREFVGERMHMESLRTFVGEPYSKAVSMLFHLSSHSFLRHRDSDGVVHHDDIDHFDIDKRLLVEANHVGIVEKSEIARQIIEHLCVQKDLL